MENFTAQIYGRVQGVSFRYYTQKKAQNLGLSGWVRNELDGSVTVVAEGSKTTLEELERFLQVGPRSAIVDRIDISWDSGPKRYHDFGIRWR